MSLKQVSEIIVSTGGYSVLYASDLECVGPAGRIQGDARAEAVHTPGKSCRRPVHGGCPVHRCAEAVPLKEFPGSIQIQHTVKSGRELHIL